jgi:hypothetical protein
MIAAVNGLIFAVYRAIFAVPVKRGKGKIRTTKSAQRNKDKAKVSSNEKNKVLL